MDKAFTDILIYIDSKNEDGSYPVHAELDDGSKYRNGSMQLDMNQLLASELDPEAYGHELFYALFSGPIRRAYDKATGRAEVETDGRVRVRLWIDEGAAELHALPWERLYHTHRGQEVALSTSTLTPFSRYFALEIAESKPIASAPLQLLFAISNPSNLPPELAPVQVEQEVRSLHTAIRDLILNGQVEVTLLPGHTEIPSELRTNLEQDGFRIVQGPTSLENLLRQMNQSQVFHFLGHGHFRRKGDSGAGTAALYMEKEDGEFEVVKDEELVSRLAALHPLPHLVFLAACESAKRSAEHPFVGLGPKLVAAGVPAVVAMQDVVPMDLARKLTADFYHNLLSNGFVDQALNQSRLFLFNQEKTDWAIPVLFMRLENGALIDLTKIKSEKPRLPYEPETVMIPEGKFTMGSKSGEESSEDETPHHEVSLPAYRIGRYPITNEQYVEFLQHVKEQEPPRKVGWFLRQPPADKLEHPVVGVSWGDAQAYCQWLSEQTSRNYRLPTEAEWEKASRGVDSRIYPWGNQWEPENCQIDADDTAPVDAHATGASPYGCHDMSGNVQEWTSTLWGADRKTCDFPYPYQSMDGREDMEAENRFPKVYRVHRGGAFSDRPEMLRCSARGHALSESATRKRGFRVVLELGAER